MDGPQPATEEEQRPTIAKADHAESSRVAQALLNEVAKLGFLCWLIAWALSSKDLAMSMLSRSK